MIRSPASIPWLWLLLLDLSWLLAAVPVVHSANFNHPNTPYLKAEWKSLSPLPDPEGFAAPFAGVSRGALIVAGGANFPSLKPWEDGSKVYYDTVFVLENPRGSWRIAGRLPRPIAYGSSVSTPNGVLCIGGSDATRHYADCFLLQWQRGKLEMSPMPPLPIPSANLCSAILGQVVYIAGGTDSPSASHALKRFWSLNLADVKPNWRELDPWPGPPRMLALAGADSGAFYLFSGAELSPGLDGKPVRHYLQDAYRYQPDKGWFRLPDMPRAAVAAPSPTPWVRGQFWILSGDDGSKIGFQPLALHPGFPRKATVFDPESGQWDDAGHIPFSRATVPAVKWRGKWIIPSGEARPGVRSNEVWSFDSHH